MPAAAASEGSAQPQLPSLLGSTRGAAPGPGPRAHLGQRCICTGFPGILGRKQQRGSVKSQVHPVPCPCPTVPESVQALPGPEQKAGNREHPCPALPCPAPQRCGPRWGRPGEPQPAPSPHSPHGLGTQRAPGCRPRRPISTSQGPQRLRPSWGTSWKPGGTREPQNRELPAALPAQALQPPRPTHPPPRRPSGSGALLGWVS